MANTRAIDQRFALLPDAERTWAVAAVHGEAGRLHALHRALAPRLRVEDNLVYLGNVLGRGEAVLETVDELLLFRRAALARPGAHTRAIAFLRGGQEEMWHKLLQLQFAADPAAVLAWMLEQGAGRTLAAYGGDARAGREAALSGPVAMSQWTSGLRDRIRAHDGHTPFMSAWRRAALAGSGHQMFVNAGLDPQRPLAEQGDSFWWGAASFDQIAAPFQSFHRIVRGYDPRHRGERTDSVTVTLDAGCGFDGPLVAAAFDRKGEIVDRLEA